MPSRKKFKTLAKFLEWQKLGRVLCQYLDKTELIVLLYVKPGEEKKENHHSKGKSMRLKFFLNLFKVVTFFEWVLVNGLVSCSGFSIFESLSKNKEDSLSTIQGIYLAIRGKIPW